MSCHRNIYTTQERRANQGGQFITEWYGFSVRIRGGRLNLPNSWDDLMRGDWSHRKCWKRLRSNQYRVVEVI